ncbi:AraC family transcriptional regulator [Nocardia sp. NBC_00403]|uniref:AraC family transcriptional regulator n=1 Tax=Nocardia sp. NBC_00403 TaxID=2975990 RepID=UPI002E1D17CC
MPDNPTAGAGIDVLTDVLVSLRLRAWLYSRTEITPPWRFDFTPSPDSTFHIIGSGGGHLMVPDAAQENGVASVPVAAGDVVVFPYGDAHTICDDPGSPLIQQVSLEYEPSREHQIFPFGSGGSATVMLCGAFRLDHEHHRPLLLSLPRLIHIPAAYGHASPDFGDIVALIATESAAPRPGAQAVLRRLTEILFIQVIRGWLEHQPQQAHGWLRALADPTIGRALGLIHQDPERRWNVNELAGAVSLSRSTFSARFTDLVGEPPIRYLTRWRMQYATRLLASGQEVAVIARQLGYDSEVAFRKAFAREIGTPPGRYRATIPNRPATTLSRV